MDKSLSIMNMKDMRPIVRGMILLPLFYLAMTSGLPPGALSRSHNHHFKSINQPITKFLLDNETISSSAVSDGDEYNKIIPLSQSNLITSFDNNNLENSNYTNKSDINSNTDLTPSHNSNSQASEKMSVVTESSNFSTETDGLKNKEVTNGSNSDQEDNQYKTLNVTHNLENNNTHHTKEEYKMDNDTTSSNGDEENREKTTELIGIETTEDSQIEHPVAEPLQNQNRTVGTIALRGKCNMTEQCKGNHTECRVGICKCALGYLPRVDNGELCGEASAHHVEVPQADPTMIGVVIGLCLMSVTLCVVLRLFAKARFRENRTIFNTPNPRLMNVSLLKGSKTLLRGNSAGGQRSRRGSQASIASEGGEGIAASSTNAPSREGKPRPHRQLSTDTTNTNNTDSHSAPSSRPISKSKMRQDSLASNV